MIKTILIQTLNPLLMTKQLFIISTCLLLVVSCKKTDYVLNSENGPQVSEVIWFESISNLNPTADSASNVQITVGINAMADTLYSDVKLTTDKGTFSDGTQSSTAVVDANKMVSFEITSGLDYGIAHIRAEVNGIAIDTVINYELALPDDLQFSPTILSTTSNTLSLNLDLYRVYGRVGKDIRVDLSYVPIDTTGVLLDIPAFVVIENVSDSVTISNPLDILGSFEVTAKTLSAANDTLVSSAIVIFE